MWQLGRLTDIMKDKGKTVWVREGEPHPCMGVNEGDKETAPFFEISYFTHILSSMGHGYGKYVSIAQGGVELLPFFRREVEHMTYEQRRQLGPEGEY